jgi:hypothetical protein
VGGKIPLPQGLRKNPSIIAGVVRVSLTEGRSVFQQKTIAECPHQG